MNQSVIDQILACPALPSPPAVAMQILELTRSPSVTVSQIGKLVQNDPALSAKVLKTVNSSLFGLPQQVTKIDRALALLGLNAVKSLVLGFSLVDSTKSMKDGQGLDLQAYWRRGIYAAVGARNVALASRACDADEAFTAAIFQDIGVLAASLSMPEAYGAVLDAAGTNHASLAAIELERIGITHAQIGAALAQKWKLPKQYIEAIRHHHTPGGASGDFLALTRVVHCGGLITDALTNPEPVKHLARFMNAAGDWFGLTSDALDEILKKVETGAKDLAKAYEKSLGPSADIQAILAEASEEVLKAQIESQRQAQDLERQNQELAEAAVTDALTKARNRKGFETDLPRLFEQCKNTSQPFVVLFADADKFKSVNDRFGHPAGDAVLAELAKRMKAGVGDRGVVCRYGGEEFAILLPGSTLGQGAAMGESLRQSIEAPHFGLAGVPGAPAMLPITISVGVAAWDPATPAVLPEPMLVVKAADEAVYASKQAGRNRVTVSSINSPAPAPSPTSSLPASPSATASPTAPAATAGAPGKARILIVEDDALAAKLLLLAFGRRPNVEVIWARGLSDATAFLNDGAAGPIGAVIADMELQQGSGLDVAHAVRAVPRLNGPKPTRVLLMGVKDFVGDSYKALGADAFVSKADLCNGLSGWVSRILIEWLGLHETAATPASGKPAIAA